MKRIIVNTLLTTCLLAASPIGYAGDWNKSWSSEKRASASHCAELFENYQLQAICMKNEKDGYQQMQGNFGLPSSVAFKAKQRCADIFKSFQLQAVCMTNEKDGYDQMQAY